MTPCRLLLLSLVCGWFSLMTAGAQAPDSFNFSQIIGGLEFVKRTDYPEKELGYSLRYENSKLLKADIYVYDNGLTGLRDGIGSDEAKAEMTSISRMIEAMQERGIYEDVKLLKEAEKTTKPTGLKFLWSRHSYRQIGGAEAVFQGNRISDSYLLVKKGKFVKIRITTKESDLAEHEQEIERFVNQVASCLQ